ncbi:T9SS type A sorting domain-containing protein [Lutibacter sp.]|uniref:T9SS type A sorting domain-containing protein n=1 Tax=Lutibacter sp. TaxID=1925666 RepID=UPI0025C32A33|nr:T9SS type A sorting domain-containing protein [Lutibacter sp.]MCF6169154.1 T9SS type A sorting domain-containing protein [Lutibacter sp.]
MIKKLLHILFITPILLFGQTQVGTDIIGDTTDDYFGRSISFSNDGSVIAIGADGAETIAGHVKIYQNISGTWTQIGADIVGEATSDQSGKSVSLSSNGNIVAIGASANDDAGSNAGQVRIYQNISGTWTQIGADIDGEAEIDFFGTSVSLSSNGSIVAIGGYLNDGNGSNAGHVRIYQNVSGTWTQIGTDIDGEAANDYSGISVSLSDDGNIVAIGASANDDAGSNAGQVRIYQNISGTWTQIGADIDGEATGDKSGWKVSLSTNGDVVAIGAYGNNSFTGQVRVYKNILGTWTQIGTDIDGEAINDFSGYSISLSGDGSIVAIGALSNDGSGSNAGHVRIYQNISGTWNQIGIDIDGIGADYNSGQTVSLSNDGNVVAIGAYGSAFTKGQVRVFNISSVLSNNEFVLENFSIYPNPVSTTLTIQLQSNLELNTVTIYDSLGKKIKEEITKTLNLSTLSKGIYYVKVSTNMGEATKTIIIK